MTIQQTGYELDGIAQRLNDLLNRAMDKRDTPCNPEKSEWRKLGKQIERALNHVEIAVDLTGVHSTERNRNG